VGGLITFEFFLKVYKTSIVCNRVKFQKKKEDFIAKRRKALKQNDMTAFRQQMMNIGEADEQCLQDVLEEVLETIGIGEEEFKETLNLYMSDEQKAPLIKAALDDAQEEKQEGVPLEDRVDLSKPTMSKNEAIAAQKVLQDLSITQIKELKTMSPSVI